MAKTVRSLLTALMFVAMAAVAYFAARSWQAGQNVYQRIGTGPGCELQHGRCRQSIDGGAVVFSIVPSSIPLMQTLRLSVRLEGMEVQRVAVDIRGLNMDMGMNRVDLKREDAGRWRGETILPICSQRRMEWEAAVQLDAGRRIELPFLFHTQRP